MTDTDNSDNPARLPPLERARRGDDLEIHEILELEFRGEQNSDYQKWRRFIEHDIRSGVLPVRLVVEDDGCLPGTELIFRRDYLAWRDRQSGFPVYCQIEAWQPPVGEPDQPESGAAAKQAALAQPPDELDKRAVEQGAGFPLPELIPPADAARWFQEQFGAYYDRPPQLVVLLAESPASEPDQPESGAAVNKIEKPESGAAAKQAALAQLLDKLDKRAAEQGAGFDRHSLPGTKVEFARLMKSHCPIFRHIGNARIASYLKGHCQFQRGAQPDHGKGAAVWALFPEYDLK